MEPENDDLRKALHSCVWPLAWWVEFPKMMLNPVLLACSRLSLLGFSNNDALGALEFKQDSKSPANHPSIRWCSDTAFNNPWQSRAFLHAFSGSIAHKIGSGCRRFRRYRYRLPVLEPSCSLKLDGAYWFGPRSPGVLWKLWVGKGAPKIFNENKLVKRINHSQSFWFIFIACWSTILIRIFPLSTVSTSRFAKFFAC